MYLTERANYYYYCITAKTHFKASNSLFFLYQNKLRLMTNAPNIERGNCLFVYKRSAEMASMTMSLKDVQTQLNIGNRHWYAVARRSLVQLNSPELFYPLFYDSTLFNRRGFVYIAMNVKHF